MELTIIELVTVMHKKDGLESSQGRLEKKMTRKVNSCKAAETETEGST